MKTEYMLVGEVLKPQGVRGEAKLKIHASNPESFLRWKTLYRKQEENYLPIAARCSRVNDGFAYVTLEGCATPEDVDRLRGEALYIDRAHAVRLHKDECYISDLIGCAAVDEDGNEVGILTDVLQYGVVDTWVFKTKKGSMMAPALKAVFPAVDIEAARIDVVKDRLAEVAVFED